MIFDCIRKGICATGCIACRRTSGTALAGKAVAPWSTKEVYSLSPRPPLLASGEQTRSVHGGPGFFTSRLAGLRPEELSKIERTNLRRPKVKRQETGASAGGAVECWQIGAAGVCPRSLYGAISSLEGSEHLMFICPHSHS